MKIKIIKILKSQSYNWYKDSDSINCLRNDSNNLCLHNTQYRIFTGERARDVISSGLKEIASAIELDISVIIYRVTLIFLYFFLLNQLFID